MRSSQPDVGRDLIIDYTYALYIRDELHERSYYTVQHGPRSLQLASWPVSSEL